MTTPRILWLAMLVAVASQLVVLIVIVGPGGPPVADVHVARLVLGCLSAAQAVVIVVVHERRLRGKPVATPSVFYLYVVCWALAEAIGLNGFVLGVLARDVDAARTFLIAGAALLLWLRPPPA